MQYNTIEVTVNKGYNLLLEKELRSSLVFYADPR